MISFIGAGKVGISLGVFFKEKGVVVRGYFSRTTESALHAATLTGSNAFSDLEKMVNSSRIVWITTNDDSIESVAVSIAALKIDGQKTFVHASGLKNSDSLICLKQLGHRVCSAHPLLAFSEIPKAMKMLERTHFFIEGEEPDLADVKELLTKAETPFHTLTKEQKPIYHAAAAILSNYLVTLVDASNRLIALTGIEPENWTRASNVLIESTLENLFTKTPKDALTGAIKRGDATTVQKHMEILAQNMPELSELYNVLGKATMRMIGDFSLKNILK